MTTPVRNVPNVTPSRTPSHPFPPLPKNQPGNATDPFRTPPSL